MTIVQLSIVIIALALLPAALNTLAGMLGLALGILRAAWLGAGLLVVVTGFYAFTTEIHRVSGQSTVLTVAAWMVIVALTVAWVRYAAIFSGWYDGLPFGSFLLFLLGGTLLAVGLATEFDIIANDRWNSDIASLEVFSGAIAMTLAVCFLMLGGHLLRDRGAGPTDPPTDTAEKGDPATGWTH